MTRHFTGFNPEFKNTFLKLIALRYWCYMPVIDTPKSLLSQQALNLTCKGGNSAGFLYELIDALMFELCLPVQRYPAGIGRNAWVTKALQYF